MREYQVRVVGLYDVISVQHEHSDGVQISRLLATIGRRAVIADRIALMNKMRRISLHGSWQLVLSIKVVVGLVSYVLASHTLLGKILVEELTGAAALPVSLVVGGAIAGISQIIFRYWDIPLNRMIVNAYFIARIKFAPQIG